MNILLTFFSPGKTYLSHWSLIFFSTSTVNNKIFLQIQTKPLLPGFTVLSTSWTMSAALVSGRQRNQATVFDLMELGRSWRSLESYVPPPSISSHTHIQRDKRHKARCERSCSPSCRPSLAPTTPLQSTRSIPAHKEVKLTSSRLLALLRVTALHAGNLPAITDTFFPLTISYKAFPSFCQYFSWNYLKSISYLSWDHCKILLSY